LRSRRYPAWPRPGNSIVVCQAFCADRVHVGVTAGGVTAAARQSSTLVSCVPTTRLLLTLQPLSSPPIPSLLLSLLSWCINISSSNINISNNISSSSSSSSSSSARVSRFSRSRVFWGDSRVPPFPPPVTPPVTPRQHKLLARYHRPVAIVTASKMVLFRTYLSP
jgi:hypothetical protein